MAKSCFVITIGIPILIAAVFFLVLSLATAPFGGDTGSNIYWLYLGICLFLLLVSTVVAAVDDSD